MLNRVDVGGCICLKEYASRNEMPSRTEAKRRDERLFEDGRKKRDLTKFPIQIHVISNTPGVASSRDDI